MDTTKGASTSTSTPGTPSSQYYYSARIQSMIEHSSEFASPVDFEIEYSKIHWSELDLASEDDEPEDVPKDNREVFENLKIQWGPFFKDYGDELVLGKKIGEGGQAEIFKAKLKKNPDISSCGFVVKVFKEGYLLRDLQNQWPEKMLQHISPNSGEFTSSPIVTAILGATLLHGDTRFGFVMNRYSGDLRTLIDAQMQLKNNMGSPFPEWVALLYMWCLSYSLETLHKMDIVHRDLKASNVLLSGDQTLKKEFRLLRSRKKDLEAYGPIISDCECSVGTVGTGFWRAPEILLWSRNKDKSSDPFTKKADIYAYGMTCYEIVTGLVPFEGFPTSNYDIVLNNFRLRLPDDMDPRIQWMIVKCWQTDPAKRPTAREVQQELRGLIG